MRWFPKSVQVTFFGGTMGSGTPCLVCRFTASTWISHLSSWITCWVFTRMVLTISWNKHQHHQHKTSARHAQLIHWDTLYPTCFGFGSAGIFFTGTFLLGSLGIFFGAMAFGTRGSSDGAPCTATSCKTSVHLDTFASSSVTSHGPTIFFGFSSATPVSNLRLMVSNLSPKDPWRWWRCRLILATQLQRPLQFHFSFRWILWGQSKKQHNKYIYTISIKFLLFIPFGILLRGRLSKQQLCQSSQTHCQALASSGGSSTCPNSWAVIKTMYTIRHQVPPSHHPWPLRPHSRLPVQTAGMWNKTNTVKTIRHQVPPSHHPWPLRPHSRLPVQTAGMWNKTNTVKTIRHQVPPSHPPWPLRPHSRLPVQTAGMWNKTNTVKTIRHQVTSMPTSTAPLSAALASLASDACTNPST